METKLERISELSMEHPDMVFTSVGHLINEEMLRDCHNNMDKHKAVGVDGVTKLDYEQNLDENLKELVRKLKQKAYRPKPARRVEIPKENGKTRPLSIYCYEDKLVQEAVRRILVAVYEPDFYDEMVGFVTGRGCHDAIRKLGRMIEHIIYRTNLMLVGHYRYYGITDNFKCLDNYSFRVRRMLFYWLNRRSQKRSYTWEGFNEMLKFYPLAKPKIYVSVYQR